MYTMRVGNVSKLASSCFSAVALYALLNPVDLRAQAAGIEYAAKFACGLRPVATSQATVWEAVSPGRYFTAVNIRNASPDTARIHVSAATTRSAPAPGLVRPMTGPNQPLILPPRLALELDCREILVAVQGSVTQSSPFLKGFVVLSSDKDLDVVAVYSAGPGTAVETMDVERVLARRSDRAASCPDLTFGAISNPLVTANLHTRIRVAVRNIGTVGASNIDVRVEDQSRTTPDRIATATIAFLGGGDQDDVILELTYQVPTTSWPSLLFSVDPKNTIAECEESNNQRRLAAP